MLIPSLESGGVLISRAVASQVPSALRGLTSVFGMGTGGTLLPSSPELFQAVAGLRLCCLKLIALSCSRLLALASLVLARGVALAFACAACGSHLLCLRLPCGLRFLRSCCLAARACFRLHLLLWLAQASFAFASSALACAASSLPIRSALRSLFRSLCASLFVFTRLQNCTVKS